MSATTAGKPNGISSYGRANLTRDRGVPRQSITNSRDEQSNVAEQESLRGGFLTENVIENLNGLNETTQFDDWIPEFDDDPEIDGDCNESHYNDNR